MFGYKLVKEERLDDMQVMIRMLDSFIFVARAKRSSAAVDYAYSQLMEYYEKWGKNAK